MNYIQNIRKKVGKDKIILNFYEKFSIFLSKKELLLTNKLLFLHN